MCVPFSIAAIILLIYHVSEPKVERTRRADRLGRGGLLTTGLSPSCGSCSTRRAWAGTSILVLAGLAVVLMVVFVIRELQHATRSCRWT